MVGIIVSGGVYSGSGDVTAQYFKTTGTAWNVALPDGTLELYGESGSYTMINNWPGSSEYWNHNEGTVKITQPNSTILYAIGVNPSKGHLYNLEINQGVDGRGVDGVQLASAVTGGTYLRIKNDLTVISGTTKMTTTEGNNGWLLEVSGHCLVQESGAALFGDASFMNGGYNQTAYGLVKLGTLQVNNNGYFSASSGTTTINGTPNGGYSIYIPDGGFYHSSGTVDVRFTGTDATQIRNKDPFYDYEQTLDTASYPSARVNWRGDGSSPYQFTIANNLTIKEGAFRPTSENWTIVVSGNVDVETGGTYGFSSGPFESAATFGSLHLDTGSAYLSTGDTTINNQDSGGYKFRAEGNPTIAHNSGTVVLDASTNGGMYKNTGSNGKWLYNLTLKNDTTSSRAIQHVYGVSVANDLIVSGAGSDAASWDIGFYNAGDGDITASGTATVINGAKLGRSIQNNTFGALTIGTKGWYDAGPTTLVGSAGIPAIFSNSDTFTHNDGTVTLEYGSGGDTKITGSARTTFHKLNTGFSYMHIGFNVEDTWATTGDGGGATNFYNASDNWVIGTTSGTGYLVTNVGTGVKAALNATVSGASEAYPAVVSGTKYDFHTKTNTLNNVDFKDAQTSDDDATLVLSNVDFSSGLTTNDSTTQTLTVTSGTWVKYGGNFLPGDGTKEIVSGATVIFEGTANYLQDNSATNYGRGDGATLWWNSTGYYSPNGGYLNNGWENVFWNADARINQDGVFRNSNLIVAKQFSASNRPIGSTTESQMLKSIRVLNGGTVSSSTNLFKIQNTGTFNTRGGFFTSSSALDLDGNEYATMGDGMGTATAVTLEAWVKPSEAPYENTMIGTDGSKGGILSSNTLNKIRVKHESVNSSYTDIDYNWVVDKWVNICFTWDGSTGKVYADGKLLKSFALSGSPYGLTKACIGSLRENGDWPWEGNIARASIWKTALTGPQVRQMMFYDWGAVDASSIDDTKCCGWYQFNEGLGTSISDMSGSGNTATLTGSSPWATAGNWNANTLSGAAHTGKLYIGTGANPTVFTNSTFELTNRELIVGSKFASKSHKGTTEYYIATSGTNDWLNYQKIEDVAPIGTVSDVKILANGSNRSYFNFDSNANNEQCNTLVNAGVVRIVTNADFYTQDFDNSQGEWIRSDVYGGTIHDDGSTPHEYEPIDLMDDLDSYFDTEELND